jgi:hypothetical protein
MDSKDKWRLIDDAQTAISHSLKRVDVVWDELVANLKIDDKECLKALWDYIFLRGSHPNADRLLAIELEKTLNKV